MRYFSYGSNMSIQRLLGRAPSARLETLAILYGHDLRFHKIGKDGSGKCDAYQTDSPEHLIFGVVYEIAAAEKPDLDTVEGLGHGYEQKRVVLKSATGESISAFTYYATRIETGLKPYHWYKHHVLTGARENGLPSEYIGRIENVAAVADPSAERHERELAIYAILPSREFA